MAPQHVAPCQATSARTCLTRSGGAQGEFDRALELHEAWGYTDGVPNSGHKKYLAFLDYLHDTKITGHMDKSQGLGFRGTCWTFSNPHVQCSDKAILRTPSPYPDPMSP